MARMIIAKNGYDVFGDKRYLSLDSNDTSFMIIDEQDIAGSATEYTHGLGYLPTILEFFNYNGQWFPIDSPIYDTADAMVYLDSPIIQYDVNKIYFNNIDSLPIKIFISGNASDNSAGSGKNTASGRLRIAKPGYDAETETDIRRFQFCTAVDLMKKDFAKSGQVSMSYSGGFLKAEVNHNLGYVPVVLAKLESNPDSNYDGVSLPVNVSSFDYSPVSYYVTSTKIVFFIDGSAATGTYVIKYNLYRNKIA